MKDFCISIELKNALRKYDGILDEIRNELDIKRAVTEKDAVYVMRIIYSAIGHVALASLFDLNDDNEPISVTHFKRRVQTLFSCYKEMFSNLNWVIGIDEEITLDEFSCEIYDLFMNTGHAYHYDYHLLPARRCQSHLQGITFLRGQAPGEHVYRSGLGAYKAYQNGSNDSNDVTISEMFHLPTETLNDFWNRIVSEADFTVQSLDNLEYLSMHLFKHNYWNGRPDMNIPSIARTSDQGAHIYYIYQIVDGQAMYWQIPDWSCNEKAYLRFCNACLKVNHSLPTVKYKSLGNLVHIEIDCRMPPEELNLLLLYSWPCDFDKFRFWKKENKTIFDRFKRCMVLDVFDALKPVYEELGYNFENK